MKEIFEISKDSFLQVSLGENLILSDKAEKILILSPEAKTVMEGYLEGKSPNEIVKVIERKTGFSEEQSSQFVTTFLSSLEAQLQSHPSDPESPESHPLPDISPFTTKGYEIYGKRCLIHYGNIDTHNILHPLIAHTETTYPPETADLTFHLIAMDDTYTFYRNGEELVREKSLVYVKNVALFEIFAALFPKKSWLTVFHGAVVKKGDQAVILSGFSGKGKSTLTTYLVQKGFSLISDDLAVLESESAGVMATPYAISLKEDTWDLLSRHLPKVASLKPWEIYGESLKFYMPSGASTENNPSSPIKKALLVFINYENGAETQVEPMTPVDALGKIIGIGAWISHKEDHLKKLMAWLESTPAYELTYPDLESAKEIILTLSNTKEPVSPFMSGS